MNKGLQSAIRAVNILGNRMILNAKYNNRSCKNCVNYKKCFMNQIGIGSGNFAEQCSFYKRR